MEYEISPGIKCKFDLILKNLDLNKKYKNGLDLGCSGNSFLWFLQNVRNKSFLDISAIPLIHYTSKSEDLMKNKNTVKLNNPLCGDICFIPFINETFDIVISLDTLEHIKDDHIAIAEISRVLNRNGLCIITVPHRKDFYTSQDQIIGHHRRYEIEQIIKIFEIYHLKCLGYFNVYGKLMKSVYLQSLNPRKTEEKIKLLRQKYKESLIFKLVWNVIVKLISKLMKIDAKYHKLKNGMNLGFLFQKK